MAASREFDLVLLGPTGYTGKLCAEHIVKNFPTNLKWAVAGRSLAKIEGVAKDLKSLNPDRVDPGIYLTTAIMGISLYLNCVLLTCTI